jgi:lipopolysaccharide export LptBFGC system permease protein LptF
LLPAVTRIALYIARQMLPWLAATLFAAALLFLVTQLLRVAPLFLGADASGAEIAKDLLLLLVPILGWALAPAFAVAVFAVGGRMSADGELVALDAAGVRRSGAALGPFAVAVALAAVSAAIWLAAAPAACRVLRADAAALAGRAIAGRIAAGSFVEPAPGVTVYADAVRGGRLEGVLVEDVRDPAGPIQIVAASAELRAAPGDAMSLRFERGDAFLAVGGAGGGPVSVRFDSLALTAPVGGAPGALDAFLPRTLSADTRELLEPAPRGVDRVAWRFALFRRVAAPAGMLALAFASAGMAFVVPWRRRGLAIACAAALFLAFHAAGRLCEALLATGALGPATAAFVPAAAVLLFAAAMTAAARLPWPLPGPRAPRSSVVEKR